jgi:hypothetical protein
MRKKTQPAIAAGFEALFGVNTVTGVWNRVEAGTDPP